MNAMFNAVHDRAMLKRLDCSLKSSTTQPDPGDESSGERFYFGLDYRAMPHGPWCSGTVYLYRASEFPDKSAKTPFYSSKPIHPIAKVNVRPQDWPLLDKVQGVDPVAQTVRQWDTYKGFPWRDDPTIHPNLRFGHLVEGTRRHIRAAYTEQIGLEQLGKMADLSPFAMLRMFRAHTGLSPHDYQSQLRIASAKSLLGKGRPIGEVGIETGYSDQSHFTRCFRREVGLTPGEYVRVQESSICSR
jgi:AraC-like DNA-binding protein